MSIYNQYINLTEQKKVIEEKLLDLQKEIYVNSKKELDTKETGVFNLSCEGYKVSITKKQTITVDQDLASMMNYGFNVKYSMNKKEYNTLTEQQQKTIDECISTKPAKPSFKIERS